MKIKTIIAVAAGLGAFGSTAFAQVHYKADPLPVGQEPTAIPGTGLSLAWSTVESGAGVLSGGSLAMISTLGQSDLGTMSGGTLQLVGGFWAGIRDQTACYADCDESGGSPRLTANDFACFVSRFAAGEAYANCDGSTTPPTLNIFDFQCFISKFTAGCP